MRGSKSDRDKIIKPHLHGAGHAAGVALKIIASMRQMHRV
jgi:hypothetical protein